MNVYELIPNSDDYNCLEASKRDRELLDLFEGKPLRAKWRPIKVRFDMTAGRFGDFPSLGRSIPVFSERAWIALRPLIDDSVEALSLTCKEGTYYAINVIEVLDCLDKKRAEITVISDRITYVDSYAFLSATLKGASIFKIPESARREVLVVDSFKKLVEKESLKGLVFKKLAPK